MEYYQKLIDAAAPYQDKRSDWGHAKITLSYAVLLLKLERADPNVVIPAIILHDIGWSQLSEEERTLLFDVNVSKQKKLEMRIKHQEEGIRLAKKILEEIEYPIILHPHILEIISQHDTRKGFFSPEDGITRDADKLWRCSSIGFKADLNRSPNYSFEEEYEKVRQENEQEGFFYSESAKKIAKQELSDRLLEYKK